MQRETKARPKPKTPRTASSGEEIKIYGLNACMSFFHKRPDGLIRAYFTQERLKSSGHIAKWCAQHKLAYHIVSQTEMDKVTEARHHEGICLVIRSRTWPSLTERLKSMPAKSQLLVLEDVGNPHNIGAILRTAAHFSSWAVVLVGDEMKMNGALYRTAEGGAESVPFYSVKSWPELIKMGKEHKLHFYATSGAQGTSLYQSKLNQRCAFCLGAEGPGLNKRTLQEIGNILQIPGSGNVESLNVSVAAGLMMGEWYRQHAGQ